MKRFLAFLILLLTFSFVLIAQESEVPSESTQPENSEVPAEAPKEPEIQTDEDYVFKMNQPGDWFIKVAVNGGFPIQPNTMNFGLDLNLGFYYFFADFFALGGNIAFAYNPTVGEKVFYCIPFMAEAVFVIL